MVFEKNEIHTDLPASGMYFGHHKNVSISEIALGKFWILRRLDVNQISYMFRG